MSEVFEGYERQYYELSANLSRKCNSSSLLTDADQKKKAMILEIKSGLADADVLIQKMDLEARSLQSSVKAMFLAKLREYKSDLNNLKREFKKMYSHEELLSSRTGDSIAVSADQRARMAMLVERFERSGERIKESTRRLLEAHEVGISISEKLSQQRETLLHSRNKLHGVDDEISMSKIVLAAMSRRVARNKWIVGSIIAALVVVIIFILSFKPSY